MKIMLITCNRSGGMVHYVSQLANALSCIDEVVVLGPEDMDLSHFSDRVRVKQVTMGNTMGNFLKRIVNPMNMFRFLRTIRDENPDIVHINEPTIWVGLALPFLSKYPIVNTIHDANPHLGSRKIDQKIGRRLHFTRSNGIIVHGRWAQEQLRSQGVEGARAIPHGDYAFLSTSYEKLAEEDAVLFFGRIEDYKGLGYLIEAMDIVHRRCPGTRLIIAGSGDFSKYAALTSSDLFEIHNEFIPDEDIPRYFQRARAVVLPYVEGTQSGVIAIAYAFKKPVIASRVGCIPEIVDDGVTGFLVPPMSVQALADSIIKVINDDELRAELGSNAYKKMQEEISWNRIAGLTRDSYADAKVAHETASGGRTHV